MSLVTAIATGATQVRLAVEPATVVTDRDDGWHRAAVTVRHADVRMLALFAAPATAEEGSHARRSVQRIALANGDLVTDARVALVWFSESGDPLSIGLVDGRIADWIGIRTSETPPLATAGHHTSWRLELHGPGTDNSTVACSTDCPLS
jgi:hypothetical protein